MSHDKPASYTRLPNVQRVRKPLAADGCNYHHYHRHTRTKLPGRPGSDEFMAVYQECQRRIVSRPWEISQASNGPYDRTRRAQDPAGCLVERHRRFFAEYGWRHG